MENQLSVKLMCVTLRNGVEIYLEDERATNLKKALKTNQGKFIELGDELINTADIVGVLKATTMEDVSMRKRGNWKCTQDNWHARNEDCMCRESKPLMKNGIPTEYGQSLLDKHNHR